jgi:hypothetical protein
LFLQLTVHVSLPEVAAKFLSTSIDDRRRLQQQAAQVEVVKQLFR